MTAHLQIADPRQVLGSRFGESMNGMLGQGNELEPLPELGEV